MELDLQWLRRLGFGQVALHATEYVLSRDDELSMKLMGVALTKMKELGAQPLIIGIASPRSLSYELYKAIPEASYAGMSWLLDAKRYVAYHGTYLLDLKRGVMECDCAACLNKPIPQISGRIEDIAEHNLAQLNSLLNLREIEAVKFFDVMIERGLTAAVTCLHVLTPQSLWESCLERLSEIEPKYLVLVGDTFDYERGDPTLWEIETFMRELRDLGTEVIPLLGCSDSNPMKLLEVMRNVLFRDEPIRPQLLNPSKIRSDAARDLLALYGASKEKVTLKLADGSVATFEHGHGLRLDRNAELESILAKLQYRRDPETLYVIGHFHRSFFDRRMKTVMLGSWQTQTPEEERAGFAPDITDILVIDEDGSFELQRGQ